MPRADDANGNAALHGGGQFEQAQCVGHLRTGTPEPLGQLLLRAAEVREQLLVRRRLFERIQLGAMEVLE